MLRFELKRIVKSRVFIILILLSLVYFAYLTVNYFRYNNDSIKYYKESAEETNAFLSEITADQNVVEDLLDSLLRMRTELDNEYNALREQELGEYVLNGYDENGEPIYSYMLTEEEKALHIRLFAVNDAIEIMDYQLREYPKLIGTTLKKAIILVNDSTQDSYTVKLNQKAIDKYNIVKEFSLIDGYTAGMWHEMYAVRYEYFYIFLVFVFLILSADVFCYERTRSLEGMVYTSKNGRGNLFSAKLFSLLSIAFVMMLVFTIVDVSIAYYIMGGQLMNEPLQVIKVYKSSTANITVLEFILCCSALRFSVLVLAIGLAAAVSQISRNVFVSIVADCLAMFSVFALYVYASGYEKFDAETGASLFDSSRFALFEKLRGFLPSCLTSPMVYFEKFDYINIANYPFTRMTTCLTITIATAIVFILLAYIRYGNVLKFIPRRAKNR